jgi:hypothetical protein
MLQIKNLLIKSRIFILIIATFAVQGYAQEMWQSWKNDSINKDKRSQIKILNDKLFKGIMNNDVPALRLLMSDKMQIEDRELDKFIKLATTSFKSNDYKILDEYNIDNLVPGTTHLLPSGNSGDSVYLISYSAVEKEMYISLFVPAGLRNELVILAIYAMYENGWKLTTLQSGQYSIFEKNAPTYYNLAKSSYDKSYLINALNYISLAKQCLKPANSAMQYSRENEVNQYYDKILKEVKGKYSFPIVLDNIDSKPKIIGIYPEKTDKAFCPMVYYQSSIKLSDTTNLRIENNKIKGEVSRIFFGIDKENEYIFYRAFNEYPDGRKKVEQYGFFDKLLK